HPDLDAAGGASLHLANLNADGSVRASGTVSRGDAVETLEGPAVEGAVILEFPDVAEAHAWYDSPAYQDALQHRLKGADYRVFVIEGLPG
ncbi:MAG: DUF1330 domain-containing protein, partial [Sphingomonas sp.]